MEIILIKDLPGLGFKDEIVNVKNGYGRNYLIPRGIGLLANKSNSKVLSENLKQSANKQEEILKEAQKLSKNIGDLVLEFKLKTGNDDKVFGSITSSKIAKLLAEKGFNIHKKNISILTKVNSIGEYIVDLKIHKDISHPIKINVTGDVSNTKKQKKKKNNDDSSKVDDNNSESPSNDTSKDESVKDIDKKNSDKKEKEKS